MDEHELNSDSGDHTVDANLFEGDIEGVLNDDSNQTTNTAPKNRIAIPWESRKWPGGVIPYEYSEGFSEFDHAQVVAKAIVRLQEATATKFYTKKQAGIRTHKTIEATSSSWILYLKFVHVS